MSDNDRPTPEPPQGKEPDSINDELFKRIPDHFKDPNYPGGGSSEKDGDNHTNTGKDTEEEKPAPEESNVNSTDSSPGDQGGSLPKAGPPKRKNPTGGPSSSNKKSHSRQTRPGPPPFPKRPSKEPSRPRGSLSPLFILLLIGLGIWLFYTSRLSLKTTKITWNGFRAQLDAGNIESVNLRGNILSGQFRGVPKFSGENGSGVEELLPQEEFHARGSLGRWEVRQFPLAKETPEAFLVDQKPIALMVVDAADQDKQTGVVIYRRFECEVPTTAFADPQLDAQLREKVESYTSTTPPDNSGYYMFFSIFVSILILFFFWRMMRRTNEQMMGGGLHGFTKSPMRRYDPTGKVVTFKDVAGLENVKKELEEVIDFLKNPGKYEKMGARVPKGTLLFGPPGTGKTLLARAVAGEAGVPFFSINGSEFMQMFVGVGASRVRELFNEAKENAPSVVFIDEIDAVGRQRGTGLGGGHDEREQTLNQLLSEMDGFVPTETVMVMASTNRPDVLDPALMRPGRFDRHVTVDRPSLKGRREIFDVYLKKIPKAANVDAEKLARETVGFTGADIENLVNEAALWATRNNKSVVDAADFEFAHEKVILGLVREETITPANKRKTAYHEAGHTLIDWFSETNTRVHKVTIIPRGRALGATYILPEEDQLNINEAEIRAKLAEYLAGRAAERLIYNQTSTGAENDLKEATNLARRMVVHWGMSEKVGPISFRSGETNPFLGREIAEMREYSEATARLIDEEVTRILREAEGEANRILDEKRELLEKLTDALVEEEELDQDRLTEILGPPATRKEE